MSEDVNVELAVKSMELARRSAVLCKAIALYQERSPEVNRLPSTLMRLVRDVQDTLAGETKCETSQLAGSARSVESETGQSRDSGRRLGSSVIRRKKATRTKNVFVGYRNTWNPGALLNHELD